jgi:predicted permease
MINLITPLYIFIVTGVVAGRWLKIEAQQLARIAIYLLTPIVVAGYVAQMPFEPEILALPFVVFIIACLVACLAWLMSGFIPSIRPFRSLLGASGGMINSGYFGIPIAGALLGEAKLGAYMLAIFGSVIFEYVVGAYLINRQVSSPRDSFIRLIKLPGLYACLLGLIISALHIPIPTAVVSAVTTFKSAYIVIGMMMLGIVLSTRGFSINLPLLVSTEFSQIIPYQ